MFYLSDEEHMLAAELLLKLSYQPDLDLLESFELRYRNHDDDSLPAVTNINLLLNIGVEG